MKINIHYLKNKYRNKEIKFDGLLSKIAADYDNTSEHAVELLKEFEFNEVERNILIELIKKDSKACKTFILTCAMRPGEKQMMFDMLIKYKSYKNLYDVIKQNNELNYIICKIIPPDNNNGNYTKLVSKIFNLYYTIELEDAYREKIFLNLLKRPDILSLIIEKIYFSSTYNKDNRTFTEQELLIIYNKHNQLLLNNKVRYSLYYNICLLMYKWLNDEHRKILVNKILRANDVNTARDILNSIDLKKKFNLNDDLLEILDGMILMDALAS